MEDKSLNLKETINHWMVKSIGIGKSPEDLWGSACQYFMWCESNPIYKTEMVRQTGALAYIELPRPFNLPALCIHLGVSPSYILDISRRTDAGEYHLVGLRIMQVIWAQKYENAVTGVFNANIVGRDLGLGEDNSFKAPAIIQISIDQSSPPLISNESEAKI